MRYICIHGHFYQPPREDPSTGKIIPQPSAAPYPDWNHRITDECYAANLNAEIWNGKGEVVSVHNNYEQMSFNFGPTLLRWMKSEAPEVYENLVQNAGAAAMAQVYHHSILPLCNARDKKTEVLWGISDFKHRYGRPPKGMWLAETAADTASLEALAEAGIEFTILAPEQIKAIRPIGAKVYRRVNQSTLDTSRPYQFNLPSGRSIVVFPYNGDLAQEVAFKGALNNGEHFAHMLIEQARHCPQDSLIHYATDGESYGHHHRKGEMALAYCFKVLNETSDVELTHYAAYLAKHPPQYEALIHEPSAWSCAHGVGRWSANCGCVIDPINAGKQEWRPILRRALNRLRDRLAQAYFMALSGLVEDPWQLRDLWLGAELEGTTEALLKTYAPSSSDEERTQIRQWVSLQRYALMMFTSCGWFFDDAAGIEPTQILRYARQAMILHETLTGKELESWFVGELEGIQALDPKIGGALGVWARV